jgi:hypothetical protein
LLRPGGWRSSQSQASVLGVKGERRKAGGDEK